MIFPLIQNQYTINRLMHNKKYLKQLNLHFKTVVQLEVVLFHFIIIFNKFVMVLGLYINFDSFSFMTWLGFTMVRSRTKIKINTMGGYIFFIVYQKDPWTWLKQILALYFDSKEANIYFHQLLFWLSYIPHNNYNVDKNIIKKIYSFLSKNV